MKNNKASNGKKQVVALKDLKIMKDPKGGLKTLPSMQVKMPTVSCVDPTLTSIRHSI